jgi:hypothetical protein
MKHALSIEFGCVGGAPPVGSVGCLEPVVDPADYKQHRAMASAVARSEAAAEAADASGTSHRRQSLPWI